MLCAGVYMFKIVFGMAVLSCKLWLFCEVELVSQFVVFTGCSLMFIIITAGLIMSVVHMAYMVFHLPASTVIIKLIIFSVKNNCWSLHPIYVVSLSVVFCCMEADWFVPT